MVGEPVEEPVQGGAAGAGEGAAQSGGGEGEALASGEVMVLAGYEVLPGAERRVGGLAGRRGSNLGPRPG